MNLFLNDEPIADAACQGTLQNTLHEVQSRLGSGSHLVVGLRCDGETVTAEHMEEALGRPTASFETVEVFSSTREDLVLGTMTDAAQALGHAEKTCPQIAELFTAGETREAMVGLGDALRVFQQVHDAVTKSMEFLQVDPDAIIVNGLSLEATLNQPKELLTQVKQALQSRDHVLLADILKYEFDGVTDCWYSLIARLRQEAEDRIGGTT